MLEIESKIFTWISLIASFSLLLISFLSLTIASAYPFWRSLYKKTNKIYFKGWIYFVLLNNHNVIIILTLDIIYVCCISLNWKSKHFFEVVGLSAGRSKEIFISFILLYLRNNFFNLEIKQITTFDEIYCT